MIFLQDSTLMLFVLRHICRYLNPPLMPLQASALVPSLLSEEDSTEGGDFLFDIEVFILQ